MPKIKKEMTAPVRPETKDRGNKNSRLNYILVIFFVVVLLALVAFDIAMKSSVEKIPTCTDGTFYNTCSLRKPYYCDAETGKLVEKASVCGCNELLTKSGNSCVSEFQTNPKKINLKYILDGEENEIDFTVYKGMADYLSNISRSIYYEGEERPSRADFKLKSMNEEEQRQLLLPLVTKIQSITDNKDDQVRIAISLVQNIPYGFSNKTISFLGNNLTYSRYPYEVLYDQQGVCGEKSALLAFLLREMDYGIVFFYHAPENHESLGIKCPVEQSLESSGYCFIETTGPSIITDSGIEYVGGITLESEPEILLISQGVPIGDDWEEYGDADTIEKIREGKLVLFRGSKLKKLEEKYGLVDEYHPA